jgi:thiamine pyrophosphate-dependent acetolactate synthase large subunit-like protein
MTERGMDTNRGEGRGAAGIDRREIVARLLRACPEALVVTGLGSPSYDAFAAGDRDRTFYLWGAMGGATPLALGLALAQPTRPVLVVTGDGEALMGMGGLATVAAQQPANLTIVVLDNGHFGETGMQRSHTSLGTRLAEVARACGKNDPLIDLQFDPDVGAIRETGAKVRGETVAFARIGVVAANPETGSQCCERRFPARAQR